MSYELKTAAAGKYRFNLKAGNGQVILSSQGYSSKSDALNGIASVRKHGPEDSNFERKDSSKGEPYFVLKAANGIESVKKNSPSSGIDEV